MNLLKLNGIFKRSSIRIYDKKIAIIPCNWDKTKSYEQMITNIFEKINKISSSKIIATNAIISVADGSFNLLQNKIDKEINLTTFYNIFNPVDDKKNSISENDFMYTREVILKEEKQILRFVKNNKNKNNEYSYSITEEGRGKLSMTFIEYQPYEHNKFYKQTNYKVTIQIYNTGIVQLKFAYTDDVSKNNEKNFINYLSS
ncbi:MAG: hypothetical protein ACFFKA_14915, partial [Candidatus Thorarchaeota archaeon]